MKLTEHEIRGLLQGKCIPGDMKVNEQLSSYLVRKFAALQEQVQKLAAENMELKQSEIDFDKMCAEDYGPDWVSELTETPATDAIIREIGAKAVDAHWNKPGFSFQHGAGYAHFGNGDVIVGATKLIDGKSGIAFAPVKNKEGGVGTEYEWTRGKNTQDVGSLFVVESSSAEGLEVIVEKIQEAIALIRAGEQP